MSVINTKVIYPRLRRGGTLDGYLELPEYDMAPVWFVALNKDDKIEYHHGLFLKSMVNGEEPTFSYSNGYHNGREQFIYFKASKVYGWVPELTNNDYIELLRNENI